MHHTPLTHVKHHPDIRWIIVVTAFVTAALGLVVSSVWNITRPLPGVMMRANEQTTYLYQLQTQINQLSTINEALQKEIKKQNEMIAALKLQMAQVATVSTSSNP